MNCNTFSLFLKLVNLFSLLNSIQERQIERLAVFFYYTSTDGIEPSANVYPHTQNCHPQSRVTSTRFEAGVSFVYQHTYESTATGNTHTFQTLRGLHNHPDNREAVVLHNITCK